MTVPATRGVYDGEAEYSDLAQPSGLAYSRDEQGPSRLNFVDTEGSSIRRIISDSPEFREAAVETVAGSGESLFDFGFSDGPGTDARFQHPGDLAL